MRAHEHVNRAIGKALERLFLLCARAKAAQHLDANVKGGKAVVEGRVVLLRQNRRRAQNHDLSPVAHGLEGGAQGDLGLAKTHVAADEAIHGTIGFHVGLHVGDGLELVGRLLIGEDLLHLLLPDGVRRIRESLDRGTARVKVDQIERELLCRLARLAHRTAPVGRVQSRETRCRAIGAHIARDAVDLLDGHVELVTFGIGEQQVVALHPRGFLTHHTRKQRDAVRRVDDVVAGLVRKGDLGDVDAPPRVARTAPTRKVRNRDHRQMRIGNHEPIGNVDIDDIEIAPVKGFITLVETFHEGNGAVTEGELEVLARPPVGDRKQRRHARLDLGPDRRVELLLTPGDVRALDGQLGIDRSPDAHDGLQREALARAEVHLGRRREQPLELIGLQSRLGRHRAYLVETMGRVIEQGAWLRDDDERALGCVLDGLVEFLVEIGREAVHVTEGDPLLEHGDLVDRLAVTRELGAQGLLEPLDASGAHCELARGPDFRPVNLADGLPRTRDHATQAVNVIAKELDAHGRGHARPEYVDGVALLREGPGTVKLTEALVAAAHELCGDILVGYGLARGRIDDAVLTRDDERREDVSRCRGNLAQQRACRRDDHHGTSQREQPDGARARTDDLVIRAHVLPRHVHALRIHADMRASDVGGDIVGKALGRVVAAHDDKDRTRFAREQRCHDERAHRCDDA